MRKVGIQDLTIQSSQLHVFEWKNVKRKGNEKSRNPIYHPKFILEPVSKGTLAGKWHEKKMGSTILPSKVHNCMF